MVRRPERLAGALAGRRAVAGRSASGIWVVARAFGIVMPFTGVVLMLALLVVGVAVPTPGGVGGFHEAYRLGATAFFGADNDAAVGAAIVLHARLVRAGDDRGPAVHGAGRPEPRRACADMAAGTRDQTEETA